MLTVALLWQKAGSARQSLELLAFIKASSANLDAVREEAAALFADFSRSFSVKVVAEAEAQSRARELDAVAADVLAALF